MSVHVVQVNHYDRPAIQAALTRACEPLGGLGALLEGRRNILLKPNLLVPSAVADCCTTHPEVYLAVAEMLLALDKHVTIGDSPAFGSAQHCLRRHGTLDDCRRLGVPVITLRRGRSCPGVPDHPQFGKLSIAAELEAFDAVINLPKLKVHTQFVFSGATKNLYGCVTGKRKAYRHFTCKNSLDGFAKMILATARAVQPVLNIGDGIQALHRCGPRHGEPYPLGTLLVSDAYLEHDWVMAHIIGLDPAETPLFRALESPKREQVAAACRECLDDPDLPRPDDFKLAPPSAIEFSFGRILRSAWKSIHATVGHEPD